jgi:predicted SnoaL-like aldol condensation-catalyzing enzyme
MREPAGYLKQSPGIGRLDTLFNKRDYAAAERCWSDRHVQHSAHIAPSRDGLFISRPLATRHTALREPTHRGGRRLRNRHGRFSGSGRPAAWIAADIVRIENGKLSEPSDVLQEEATKLQSVSGLPMFGEVP